MDPFRKKAPTGWSLTSDASECVCETCRVSDHPVCGSSVASRLLIDAAATLCKEGNVPKLKHVCLSKFIWDTTLGRNHGCSGIGARSAHKPLASAFSWCRMHGDDRQPAIRLDLFRQSNEGVEPLGPRCDPGGVQSFRAYGNVADPDRRMVRGQIRTEDRRHGWRCGRRHRLESEQ